MSKPRIIIERENYGALVKAAKEDGRSQVKQLNHLLAWALAARDSTKKNLEKTGIEPGLVALKVKTNPV